MANNPAEIARIIVNQRDPACVFRNIFETFRQTSLSQCKRTMVRARPDIRGLARDEEEEEEERRSYLRFEIRREIVEPARINFAIWRRSIDTSRDA